MGEELPRQYPADEKLGVALSKNWPIAARAVLAGRRRRIGHRRVPRLSASQAVHTSCAHALLSRTHGTLPPRVYPYPPIFLSSSIVVPRKILADPFNPHKPNIQKHSLGREDGWEAGNMRRKGGTGSVVLVREGFDALRRLYWVLAGLWIGLACAVPLQAESPLRDRPNAIAATTSKAAKDSALRSIPLEQLDARARAKVDAVLARTSLFRRLPIRVVPCDPELYLFAVQHPDVVANVWQVLGMSQMAMDQIGDSAYRINDGAGTRGTVEFLYRSHDTQLVYLDGSYCGPPFPKPVEGRGLLILKSGYVQETDGRCYITTRLDAFVSVEPGAVDLMTRTLQPLVGKNADSNFVQTVAFLASLSRTAEVNHSGMQRLASKLTRVRPEVRQQFAELSQRIFQKVVSSATPRADQTPLMVRRSTIGEVTSGRETSPGPTP